MKTRVISAIVALAIVIPLFLLGGIPWGIAVAIVAALAYGEIVNLKESHHPLPNEIKILGFIGLEIITLSRFRVDFTEIGIRGRLNTDSIMKEVKIIQIHCNNLILRIVALQFDSNHPLDRFLEHTLHRGFCMFGIQLLSQLLGDGRSTTSALLSQNTAFDDSTRQCIEIDAGVLVETDVLCGHQRLHQGW